MDTGKIKILFISRTSKLTGAENILLDIAGKLDKKRFLPLVVLPDKTGPLFGELDKNNIKTVLVKMPFLRVTYNPFLLFWFFVCVIYINILFFNVIIRNKIDIISCHTIQEAMYIFLPAKFLRKKLIISFKNILDKRWKKYFRAKFSAIFADRVIAVSEKTALDFSSFNTVKTSEKKLVVVYDCLDHRGYTEKAGQGEEGLPDDFMVRDKNFFKIVNVGSITSLKGQMLLLEALAHNKIKNLDLKVFFVGDVYDKHDYEYKEKLIKFINENNFKDRVFLTGYQKNVKKFINWADTVIHCPIIDDALPRVILESFALKKIVIGTKVGGVPEMIQDNYNGFLVDVDSAALAEKIHYVYSNLNNLDFIKDNAYKIVIEKFSLDKQVDTIQNIFEELVHAGK